MGVANTQAVNYKPDGKHDMLGTQSLLFGIIPESEAASRGGAYSLNQFVKRGTRGGIQGK